MRFWFLLLNKSMLLELVVPIVFGVYFFTAFPSLPGGDSGELLAESCLHGTAHPPGYPTFLMLSQFWTQLLTAISIQGTVAWKVNIMCAFFGALAAGFIGLASYDLVLLTRSKKLLITMSLISALLFAFSPLVWEYSISAEVFSLNNAILSMLLFLTLRIIKNTYVGTLSSLHLEEFIYLSVGSFLSGLTISNQHAGIIQLIVVIPVVFFFTMKRLTIWRVVSLSCSFLLGIAPYYYLVLSSAHPAKGSWGDQTSLEGLFRHVTRAEYGTFQLGIKTGNETFLERVFAYLAFTSRETYHLILPLLVVGVVSVVCPRLFYDVPLVTLSDFQTSKKKMNTVRDKGDKGADSKSKKHVNININASANTNNSLDREGETEFADSRETGRERWSRNSVRALHAMTSCLLAVWIVYTCVWHAVLSNLPLSAPMPFAVHSRFWMQPTIPLAILSSLGLVAISQYFPMGLFSDRINFDNFRLHTLGLHHMTNTDLISISICVLLLVRNRYFLMDKSQQGWMMHKYGQSILNSLTRDSIYISHTDLDWNSVRYLQACENKRDDLILLSFQLMPYPWFEKQQIPLYDSLKVKFPTSMNFSGVSTDRSSEGNARLITTILQ